MVTERLIPFAPREVTREKMWELYEEYKERVSNLEGLKNGGGCLVPIMRITRMLLSQGTGKRGRRSLSVRSGTIRI
ncbi:hypothetical protein AKJ40_04035 [candidate division MSBL1 archaeon SCGC-AAA259M10]|uniref:Uncharacterized protein n=1 Tax=candidate division MSBL1 archaeon SCGC-AAA259M10 TaxID=1698270 RepID=A0A133UY05_9EURY|nr:hypothetical protein AKJ40_04035 [candidate division MSBL1 archaeon SCGC-AAA259M10]